VNPNTQQSLADANTELSKININLPGFGTKDTEQKDGELAKLGKMLTDKSAELTKVISGDLNSTLDLNQPKTQQEIAAAIITAKQDVAAGLTDIAYWKNLGSISDNIDDQAVSKLKSVLQESEQNAIEAQKIYRRTQEDTKFQLKAVAASWHNSHDKGDIEKCPLCTTEIKDTGLVNELNSLKSAGEYASRTFTDNLQSIMSDLNLALPSTLRHLGVEILGVQPKLKLQSELRSKFSANPRHSEILERFKGLADTFLKEVPQADLLPSIVNDADESLKYIYEKISVINRILDLKAWFDSNKKDWESWWENLCTSQPTENNTPETEQSFQSQERLAEHLERLSDALTKAEPYRLGASAMRRAWKHGSDARKIEIELKIRSDIADSIKPLKSLGSLAESEVRDTIDGLSSRMERILSQTLISEKVKFKSTHFSKKDGVTVRASVNENIHIDASTIANASWTRAVLWAFIFALREESVEQLGLDQFPVIVLDDPQATFDDQHRHRWSQQIASLQNGPGKIQVILATHDDNFIQLIRYSGVSGREALLSSAGPDTGHMTVFDGENLQKVWNKADDSKLDVDARVYISAARIQIEAILRIMLRGEEAGLTSVSTGFVIGESRNKIEWLISKGKAPWDKGPFLKLTKLLNKNLTAIKHLEMSHHASSNSLGMAEAIDVHKYLNCELREALLKSFKTQREHFRAHGGLTSLYAAANVLPFPDGYQAEVKTIPLNIFGRAAALSDGKVADGCINLEIYASTDKRIVLAQHSAYRLLTPTLEPVASRGDILILKQSAEPAPNSLVVAATEDKLFARRLELAENHTDVVVLTAQANNPRKIAPPVIAAKSTFELQKVVGVIYDDQPFTNSTDGNEIAQLAGSTALSHLVSGALGLVEIAGDSAEPIALNGQYIIIKNLDVNRGALGAFSGKPVIAEDDNSLLYFKRLRLIQNDIVVLESLEPSGEYGPVVLSLTGAAHPKLTNLWSVVGVIFELPT
jgi:hypothetical protein